MLMVQEASDNQDETAEERIMKDNPNLARELSAKEREVQQLMSDIQKIKQDNQDEKRNLESE